MNISPINSTSFKSNLGSIASTSATCAAIAGGLQAMSNARHYSKNKELYSTPELQKSFKMASAKSVATSALLSAAACAVLNGAISAFKSRN